jgi:site-specific recombinase XerD
MSHFLAPLSTIDEQVLNMIAAADLADSTRYQYLKAVKNYLEAGHSLTDQQALATHAAKLPKSSRAFLKAAVSQWVKAMATAVKAGATPENVNQVQATLYRFEALQAAIHVEAARGQKAHTWLSQLEVKRLMGLPSLEKPIGRRDKIALGLCVAAGLRREEAVSLRFDNITHLPVAEKTRAVLNVKGKGAKDRAVPINDHLAADIQMWGDEIGREGLILRRLGMAGELGDSLTAVSLFRLVNKYGRQLGKPDLAPHDLRRTYAQLGYEAGVPITQISKLLGHASVATTQRYLNLELDVATTISDFIPY